jgi:hypothetical protein
MTDSGGKIGAPARRTVYLAGAWAAVIAALLFRRNLAAEVSLFTGQTPPSAAADWLALFQSDRLLGLTFLNVFDIVNYLLLGLLFLGLYAALRRIKPGLATLALWLGTVGVAAYLASNQAFAMLALSDRYAATTTEAQRTGLVAAGEALLATNNPAARFQGTGILLGLFLVTLAGLIFAIGMLRGGAFGWVTAWLGIIGNGLILGYFVMLIFAPSLTFLPHTLGAIPLVLWELLTARRLFQLAREMP